MIRAARIMFSVRPLRKVLKDATHQTTSQSCRRCRKVEGGSASGCCRAYGSIQRRDAGSSPWAGCRMVWFYWQPANLNEPMRVDQLKLRVVLMYSDVNQKVQSSEGHGARLRAALAVPTPGLDCISRSSTRSVGLP